MAADGGRSGRDGGRGLSGGAIDGKSCDKMTEFIVLCDSFNIPLVLLADTPGFLVGLQAEHEAVAGGVVSGPNAVVGAALCMLGVLCGLTFMVVLRGLWRRRMPPVLGDGPRMPSLLPAPAARAHPIVFSLTQLGLSRT